MDDTAIDRATFAELQDTAGAEFVVELVTTFLEEAPQMLADLRRAIAAADATAFRRAAHTLKSNSLTFGALPLAALARELELGGLPTDAAAADAVDREYARTAAALKGLIDG